MVWQRSVPKPSRFLIWLPAAFLLLYLGRSALLFVSYNWDAINFPYVLDYGEGPILDQVMRLAGFHNIYQPSPSPMQYTVSNYPPVYHLAQLPFAWVFGPAYWYGRVISSLSILACSVLIGLTLHAITKDRLAALTGGLTLLAVPYVASWSPLCRVDSLALALSWAGLFVAARWPKVRATPFIVAVLLSAAIYTKHSYALAAPYTAFIWLAREGSKSQALKNAAWVVCLCIGLFLVMDLVTHGGFYFNIVTANRNRFIWSTLLSQARQIWYLMPFLIMIGAVFVLTAWRSKAAGYWLVASYFITSLISAAAIGKVGSNVNYFFELSAGLSLMAGAAVAALEGRWKARGALLVVLALQAVFLFHSTRQVLAGCPVYLPSHREASALVLSEIRKTEGPVLADTYMGLLPLAGRGIALQPFEMKQLSEAGVWDETPLVEDIRKKKFGLIAIYAPSSDVVRDVWTEAQLRAIRSSYHPAGRVHNVFIYKPF